MQKLMLDFSLYSAEESVQVETLLIEFIKDDLLKTPLEKIPPVETRVNKVDELTESFYQHFGRYPSSVALYYLSNYILLEDIKDKDPYKIRQENAFHSPRQLRLRFSREYSTQCAVLDYEFTQRVHNIAIPKFTGNVDEV